MPLSQLKVSRFRNLHSVDIRPSPSLNFLFGINGSGKTSLLEAISVLAHGRSFRTRKYRRLIQQDEEELVVYGRVEGQGEADTTIGVQRKRNGVSQFRINGAGAGSSAELAATLPLLVLNAESFGLLMGPPKQRRQFLDWLVFHVKHEFRNAWRDYGRCVKQRNSLLRRDKIQYSDVRPWDREIARLSLTIERERLACIDPLLEQFERLAGDLETGQKVAAEIEYINGWRGDDSYEAQLQEAYPRDRRLGYTTLGPHKSDLKITIGGVPAAELLSRGQQKSMIAGLYVAEARSFTDASKRSCIFLIDDMPAELDEHNMARVGRWINETAAQVFVTSVDHEPVRQAWPDLVSREAKVFHVKQGSITDLSEIEQS